MDLDVLISRAAVARTQARDAKRVADQATEASREANRRWQEADDALQAEISERVDKLDPKPEA